MGDKGSEVGRADPAVRHGHGERVGRHPLPMSMPTVRHLHRHDVHVGMSYAQLRHQDIDHATHRRHWAREKLMHDGKRPAAVGFFFSLGHSTIVVLASVAMAATATAIKDQFGVLQNLVGSRGHEHRDSVWCLSDLSPGEGWRPLISTKT
jgi:hypothetical protein